jgi:hypothetical protein
MGFSSSVLFPFPFCFFGFLSKSTRYDSGFEHVVVLKAFAQSWEVAYVPAYSCSACLFGYQHADCFLLVLEKG